MLVAQGDLDGALAPTAPAWAIAERLAAADPATPTGSATSRSARRSSATCWWRGAPGRRARRLPRRPGDRRAAGGGRSRQRRLAARPLGQPGQARRRAGRRRATWPPRSRLPRRPGHRRAPGRGRPRQRRLAARCDRIVRGAGGGGPCAGARAADAGAGDRARVRGFRAGWRRWMRGCPRISSGGLRPRAPDRDRACLSPAASGRTQHERAEQVH